MSKASDIKEEVLFTIFSSVAVGGLFSGFGLLAYQLYIYLYDGHWMSVNTVDGFLFILNWFSATDSIFMSWLTKPGAWIGVHKILLSTPMPAFLILFPCGLLLLLIYLLDKSRDD